MGLLKPKQKEPVRLLGRQYRSAEPTKAWQITLIYTICGLTWILLSDSLLNYLVSNPTHLAFFNVIKGWIYVFATSLLLYFLISSALDQAKRHEQCIQSSYAELEKVNSKLERSEHKLREQLEDNRIYQEQLHYLAYFDPLTKLPNSLSLDTDLDAYSREGTLLTLFFINLDNFKDVNDFRSHKVGDHILKLIAERMVEILGSKGKIYRFGGDEFIILIPGCQEQQAQGLATAIIKGFREPFFLAGNPVYITPSVGIACETDQIPSTRELVRLADLAMHDSKKRGGNCFTFYHTELSDANINRVLIEGQLRTALKESLFTLAYQPEVSLPHGQITGFEALLRWNPSHAITGDVEQVIGVAETTSLIVPMGEWILREACLFLKKVHAAGWDQACISVNVSVVQLSRFNFNQKVLEILQEVDLEPRFLRLEITESVLMEGFDLVNQQIESLRKIGVKMALDDFGKGYSSLSYLKILPLDMLKIDKNFIDHVPTNPKDAFLVSQIIAIGKNLGLQVVAEGVETKEQLEFLQEHHCDRFQGYYYSQPVPEAQALGLLTKS